MQYCVAFQTKTQLPFVLWIEASIKRELENKSYVSGKVKLPISS